MTGLRTMGFPGKRMRTLIGTVLLACVFCMTVYASGKSIECLMTGEDVGNGYEYTIPTIGTFTVNGLAGETMKAAVFSFEDGLYPVLYKDNEKTAFSDGMVLNNGSYDLRIYSNEELEGDYGIFRFKVENDFDSSLLENAKKVTLIENPSLTMAYQEKTGMFRYTLPNESWFEMNIPVGGWSRGNVTIVTSDDLNLYSVRVDGEPIEYSENQMYNKVGSYEILALSNELGIYGEYSYSLNIGFHLYLNKTMDLSLVRAPYGLMVSRAELDGQKLPAEGEYLTLTQDGAYEIAFSDSKGRECWQMEIVRDTVPPAVVFDQEVDGKLLTEEVTFQIPDPETKVKIYRNGQEVQAAFGKIAVNGTYRMEAEDTAGNMRQYNFTMQSRFDIPMYVWFIIPGILLAAGGGIYLYWRGNMRVL